MARRKVGNLMALAVLAALCQRPMHPYEIASVIRSQGKDRDMGVKWGSFYTVVQNLERHGFVEAVGTSRQGARPERTIYRVTQAGTTELADWTRELLEAPVREYPRFAAGLSVFTVLPPDQVVELLRARLERLEASLAEQRDELAANADVPRLFLVEDEYMAAMTEAETSWVRSLLDELTSGTFPGLAGWRRYQETGELPPELAELARQGGDPD